MMRYVFESMSELAAVPDLPYANSENGPYRAYSERMGDNGHDWVCQDRRVETAADVSTYLKDQMFEPGVRRIEQMAAGLLAPTPKSRRRKCYQTDNGDELDLQRVWQGDLEHAWRNTRREQSVGPSRVLIGVNGSISGSCSSTELALRGSAALALASTLRAAGYTVGVSVGVHATLCDTADTQYSAEVKLLEPDQELDIHRLASLAASGLLFRGVLMNHMCHVTPARMLGGIARVQSIENDTLDKTGYDYVALIENRELRNEPEALIWLNKHLDALQGK